MPCAVCAGLAYFAGDAIADQWGVIAPTLPDLAAPAWAIRGWDWLKRGRSEEGYLGLPMTDTEMGADHHGCFAPAEPPSTPYLPPQEPRETTALLQDPQAFPSEP